MVRRCWKPSNPGNRGGRIAGVLATAAAVISLAAGGCGIRHEDRVPELPEGWSSLFDGRQLGDWTVTNFGGEGEVQVEEGYIRLDRGEDLTGITWAGEFPKTRYEIHLEAMRLQGNDFFCGLTFPLGNSFASLIVAGWAGSVVGISSIDGKDASENETSRRMVFENNRWYRIRMQITEERIEAWIDDEQVVDLPLEGRRFEVRPEVRLSRPLGIAAWRSRAALRDLRWRPAPGDRGEGKLH